MKWFSLWGSHHYISLSPQYSTGMELLYNNWAIEIFLWSITSRFKQPLKLDRYFSGKSVTILGNPPNKKQNKGKKEMKKINYFNTHNTKWILMYVPIKTLLLESKSLLICSVCNLTGFLESIRIWVIRFRCCIQTECQEPSATGSCTYNEITRK